MPDLLDFAVARAGLASLTVTVYDISCRIVDSEDHSIVLRDFTGDNRLRFPQVLGQIPAARRDDFLLYIAQWLIDERMGS